MARSTENVMPGQPVVGAVLEQIPARLRAARQKKGLSLAVLARATGVSTSTLSRLESGLRRPSLELLLPVATALGVSLDEIVAMPTVVDPRVAPQTSRRAGRVLIALSQQQGEPRAYKMIIPAHDEQVHLRSHDGHEWLYVLRGRLRVRLQDAEFILTVGEAAEFDCTVPHWFGAAGRGSVEVLSLFGRQGERIHLRTPPSKPSPNRRRPGD